MPDLTPEQIFKLRARAMATRTNPPSIEWWDVETIADMLDANAVRVVALRDADFIAAVSPAVVLSLLDELERMRAAMPSDEELRAAQRCVGPQASVGELEVARQWLFRIDAARKGTGR